MPGLSKKETARLLDYIEPQGVGITPVKSGYMLRFPNGKSTVVHLSVSDHRGPANMRAILKRNGIEWPTDKLKGGLSKKTIEQGDRVLNSLANSTTIVNKTLHQALLLIEWVPSEITLVKFMQYRGYQKIGRGDTAIWKIPMEIEFEETEVIIEEKPSPIVPIHVESAPTILTKETTVEIREFLDTKDSWTVDTTILPETLTLKDMRLMFAAMGISFEVRVWK